jgi:acetyl-CoA synthetase
MSSGDNYGCTWDRVRQDLDGLPGGQGLNIAHEAVDRHAAGPLANQPAIRYLSRDGHRVTLSYADLREQSNRFANLLHSLGVTQGQNVFTLAGPQPEVYIAALGSLKNRSVFCALFSVFGPEPIYQRLSQGDARVVVTTRRLYEQKLQQLRPRLPALQHVLLIDSFEDSEPGLWSLPKHMAAASSDFTIPPTDPEDAAFVFFTSGTTGASKGVVHVHQSALVHYQTGRQVLDLRAGDVYWCTADPGWVTGICYGLIAPLLHGVTNLVVDAPFDSGYWYGVLASEAVTVWYTSPTAMRRLMRVETDPRRDFDLSRLRSIFSVGEPLNPQVVVWAQDKLGLPVHDTWWQTETGGILIANAFGAPIRAGSMGLPLDGIDAAIVQVADDGTLHVVDSPGTAGLLAVRAPWPSMFRGYLHEDQAYRDSFIGPWYLTGDIARQDADGYFWFVGRADDIINTSGHRVGPFEIESVLLEHPAVAEAGVIGKPDPMIGEVIKAFVSLKPGTTADEQLRREILGFGRLKLGAALAPREIEFRGDLPKTKSGKILRRLLKSSELELPPGDVSTTVAPAARTTLESP